MSKVSKEVKMRETINFARRAAAWSLACALLLLSPAPGALAQSASAHAPAPSANASRADAAVARDVTDSLRLVTEFEVNGRKGLVKRREGSQTGVAGLFLRGRARNVTADYAGVAAVVAG